MEIHVKFEIEQIKVFFHSEETIGQMLDACCRILRLFRSETTALVAGVAFIEEDDSRPLACLRNVASDFILDIKRIAQGAQGSVSAQEASNPTSVQER